MRSLSPDDRQEVLHKLTLHLAGRREIIFAYVHGSFAEGRPFRDIDVAVWVRLEGMPLRDPLDYEMDAGIELSRLLRVPVDIRRLNDAPISFQYHATRGIVLFSRDDEIRYACVERSRLAYWDFEPVARAYLAEVLRG